MGEGMTRGLVPCEYEPETGTAGGLTASGS